MVLKIVQVGDATLRTPARDILPEEIRSPELTQLIEWMRETMTDAPGVGLAAPQVGVGLRVAVIEDRAEYIADLTAEEISTREREPVPFQVIINPRLIPTGENVEFFEGCLSLSGFTAVVPRSRSVRVSCLDQRGDQKDIVAHGWYARILQHEIDHLNGELYLDKMHPKSFMSIENYKKMWRSKPLTEVLRELGESSPAELAAQPREP